jgi:hypothetical protein
MCKSKLNKYQHNPGVLRRKCEKYAKIYKVRPRRASLSGREAMKRQNVIQSYRTGLQHPVLENHADNHFFPHLSPRLAL